MTDDPHHDSLLLRLHRALGPIAGGLLLDFLDLATFGPIGLFGGFIIAAAVGWWLGTLYEFKPRNRVILAALAAAYTAIPMTEPFPIATAVGAVARFREKPTESSREERAEETD